MDKRLWLAMILSFLLIFLYQSWVMKRRMVSHPAPPAPVEEVKKEPPTTPLPVEEKRSLRPNLPSGKSEKEVRVENGLYTAIFSTTGASLKSFKLKQYRTSLADNSPPVELIKSETPPFPLSNRIETTFLLSDSQIYDVDKESIVVNGEDTITFSLDTDAFRIIKQYKFFKDSYLIELNVQVINKMSAPLEEKFSLHWSYNISHENSSRYHQISPVFLVNDSVKREVLKDGEAKEISNLSGWFGMDLHYFLTAIIPERVQGLSVRTTLTNKNYIIEGNYPAMVIPLNSRIEYKFRLFLGPKEISLLKSAGNQLDRAVNLGWFHAIGYPLLILLKWLYGIFPNYGIAIILLTIIVRIIFFPLSISSYRSMKKLQLIQPEMKEIQKKYANDRERMSREIWELYRRHKVNPFGGCLPVIIQIPVFIALYQVLMNAIELRHAPFVLWINDLSAPDFLFAIPLFGTELPIRLLPILMGITMYIQQKITPVAGDPQQMKIMLWMPVILTVMLYGLPSGLTLYWTVSNLLSIIQQYYINRKVHP